MLKRFCDRCGKKIADKWFNVKVTARSEDETLPSLLGASCGCTDSSRIPIREYCPVCIEALTVFLNGGK